MLLKVVIKCYLCKHGYEIRDENSQNHHLYLFSLFAENVLTNKFLSGNVLANTGCYRESRSCQNMQCLKSESMHAG